VVRRETTAQMMGNFLSGACAIILHLDDCNRCGAIMSGTRDYSDELIRWAIALVIV